MKKTTIIGIVTIVVFLVVGFFAFSESKIEYSNFQNASENQKTCQFIFYMKDENNSEMKVVLDGARPNNFEMAESVVAKGKFKDGYFHAKEVLTKCPSKYEGKGENLKQSGI